MDYSAAVSKIKYKPGWSFHHVNDEWGHTMRIMALVPHSVTLEPTLFQFVRIIPPLPDETAFKGWMRVILKEAELHELDEFFRFDGELVNDPHKPVELNV